MKELETYRGRARDPVSVSDVLRVVGASLAALLAAVLRRALGRRRRSAWSFGFEVTVAAYRGSWSMLPRLGLVRWRNVGEALTPLRLPGVEARFVQYTSGAHQISGAWLAPPAMNDAVVLYFHGGGFVFSSLRTHGALIVELTRSSRARTLALEYRLAPEHPAPAALEDALSAYRAVLAEGVPPSRIVLVGDSAGGTLVLTTLLALRDAGAPLPAAGVAISPWVDFECSGTSFETNADFDFVGKEHCQLAAAAYLAGADARGPGLSPLFAQLAGLPPLLVQAGEAEVLIDQVREFVQRARAAEVDVKYSEYPDMIHVWHMLASHAGAGRAAIDELGAYVRLHASERCPAQS